MARRVPNQAKENNAHYRRSERYVSMLDGVYQKATDEAVNLALLANHSGNDPFKWSDYPQTKSKLDQITRSFANDVRGVVVNGTSAEWTQSNEKNDRLARAMLGVKKGEPISKRFERYFNHNDKPLSQFISRKDVCGMNLSKRVWNLTEQFKSDLELSLSDGLSIGKSATELSRDVRKHLNEPSKLFRRVRDDKGNLQLSNPAKAYHPGAGVCRSSYKNAQRLTRTEINMAYRNADRERWSKMDFVVGFEVKRSGRGYDCSVCSSLTGKYPKDFKFVGWHPSCRCYVIPILKTDEEFWAWDGRGEAPTSSVNEVKDVPGGFSEWTHANMYRAKSWNSTPYFIRDNADYIPDRFKIGTYSEVEKNFVRKTRTKEAIQRSIDSLVAKYPNIPETELAAVHIYTQGKQLGNFRDINRYLKSGVVDEYVESTSILIGNGLAKLPKVEGTVYRGTTMSMKKLEELYLSRQGQIVEHSFFTSASQSREVAKGFTDYAGVPTSHKKIIFDIQSKNGRDIGEISEFNGIFNPKNQREVLFGNRAKYYVSPGIETKDGCFVIKLIEQ